MTTEKELDTVEVLKAIQKAKEVKDRKSGGGGGVGGGKKVHSPTLSRDTAAGLIPSSHGKHCECFNTKLYSIPLAGCRPISSFALIDSFFHHHSAFLPYLYGVIFAEYLYNDQWICNGFL